jgi:hypothetical protein
MAKRAFSLEEAPCGSKGFLHCAVDFINLYEGIKVDR